jgi:hypothetical protein
MKQVRAACQSDLKRLCAGMEREKGWAVQCIKAHQKQLSAGCNSAIQEARKQRAAHKRQNQSADQEPAVPAASPPPAGAPPPSGN